MAFSQQIHMTGDYVFYDTETFSEQIVWHIEGCRGSWDAGCMDVSLLFGELCAAVQVKIVGDDTDGVIGDIHVLTAVEDIFNGVGGGIFHDDPVWRDAFACQIVIHTLRFAPGFVVSLTAGDDAESGFILQKVVIGSIETEAKGQCRSILSYLSAKNYDIIQI